MGTRMLFVVVAASVVAWGSPPLHGQTPLATGFTYQGLLKDNGNPINGSVDLDCSLYGSATGGTLIVATTELDVPVTDGLVNVVLDFGANPFNGDARWLQVAVRYPAGSGSWIALNPRQPLTVAPYALQTRGIHVDENLRVGIGTDAPLSALHLGEIGDYYWGRGDGWGDFSLNNGTLGFSIGVATSGTGTGDVYLWSTGGTERMFLANPTDGQILTVDNDSIGIGTVNPASKLHVSDGDVRMDGNLQFYEGDAVALESRTNSAGKGWRFRNIVTDGIIADIATSASDGTAFIALRDKPGTTTTVEIDADRDDMNNGVAGGLVRLSSSEAGPGGELILENGDGDTSCRVRGGSAGNGALLEMFNGAGTNTVLVAADELNDGTLSLFDAGGHVGVTLGADHASSVAGQVALSNDAGFETVKLLAATGASSGGQIALSTDTGTNTIDLDAEGSGGAGEVTLNSAAGVETVEIVAAEGTTHGAQITLRTIDGIETIEIDAERGAGGGAYIEVFGGTDLPAFYAENSGSGRNDATLRVNNTQPAEGMAAYLTNNSNFATMHVENDGTGQTLWLVNEGGGDIIVARDAGGSVFWVDGSGITNSKVLRIHGGADLSEGFEVRAAPAGSDTGATSSLGNAPEPGMVVSIDPENPGKLAVSTECYDRKVAGIISGAGGVKPGMLMGQGDSDADGDHPVALTGRVFCRCVTTNGPIEPGDLLTTSDKPGHAMRVSDYDRAQGAIIGKAMTSLAEGDGLVLVLVSLQ